MAEGKIVIEEFTSEVLRDNPLGDPFVRQVPIYLPPSYNDINHFPVIYLLSGFASTGRSFLNYRFGRPSLAEQLDKLIADGKMAEAIVVMPDCMTRYGGAQFLNSEATGNYMQHITEELIPFVDANYYTLPAKQCRAVVGKSSGGYGALILAMHHPDKFSALACHSGDMHFEFCYAKNFPKASVVLEKYDYDIPKFFEAYESAEKKPGEGFVVLDMIGMSAAYSPNANKKVPENFDVPFDLRTCERKPDVWQRWIENDPLYMIREKKYQDALRSMTQIFIDCGKFDEYNLQFGARQFSDKLHKLGITHIYEEFPDSHMDTSYRYNVSLPILVNAIK